MTPAQKYLQRGAELLARHLGRAFSWNGVTFLGTVGEPTTRFGPGPTGFEFGREYNVRIRVARDAFPGEMLPAAGDTFVDSNGEHFDIGGAPTSDGVTVWFTARKSKH